MINKTFTLSALFSFIVFCSAFSQSQVNEIPNFILAKNANPTVFLRFPALNGIERGWGNQNKVSKKELQTLQPNEDILAYTISVLNKFFIEVGIEPAAYIDVANEYNSHPTILQYNNAIRRMLHENQSQYIIDITFISTPSLSQVKKGKAELIHYLNPMIGVYQYNKGDVAEQKIKYFLHTPDLQKSFNAFSKAIAAKSEKSLLKEMTLSEFSQQPFIEYKEYNTIPIDLDKNKIAVIELDRQDAVNSKYKSIMDKYPFNYQIISNTDKIEQITNEGKEYKYAMIMRNVNYEKTTSKDNTTDRNNMSGIRESKTTTVVRSYFVLQDLETFDEYYGMPIESLEVTAESYAPKALKNAVELVRKSYNIDKGN